MVSPFREVDRLLDAPEPQRSGCKDTRLFFGVLSVLFGVFFRWIFLVVVVIVWGIFVFSPFAW